MTFPFDIEISTITIALLGIATIAAIFLLTIYRSRIARVARHKQKSQPQTTCTSDNMQESDSEGTDTHAQFDLAPVADSPASSLELPPLPSASVVIYSNDEASNLARLLPQVLGQDYPAQFEVIVVNDGSAESTSDVVSELQMIYPNLYLTYTPDRSRNLSRKKLAITLGIKAARYDVVVMLNANSRVNSNHWLSLMTRNFTDGIDVVIGYATPDIESDTFTGRRRRAFDRVAEAVTYLSAAIGNTPFRGFSYNLAYRRECFFKNKGFSRSLNLHYGDDDVFINEIANKRNTAVELCDDSIVECRFYHPVDSHNELKRRYSYTAKYLRKSPRLLFGACSLMAWIWLLASTAAIISTMPNLISMGITATIAFILALTVWIPLITTWRSTMSALRSRKLFITIPWFVLTRPFYNAFYKIKNRLNYRRNHTWIKR